MKSRVVACVFATIAVLACCVGVAPEARADTIITSQPYQSSQFFDDIRQSGATGKGTTIDMIGGWIDGMVHELDHPGWPYSRYGRFFYPCEAYDPTSWWNATNMASLIIHSDWGISPDSEVLSSQTSTDPKIPLDCPTYWNDDANYVDRVSYMLNFSLEPNYQSVDVRPVPDVFLIADALPTGPDLDFGYAVAHASLRGVPVVAPASAVLNPGVWNPYAQVNGVIAVGSLGDDGQVASWTPTGEALTVLAPGTINGRDKNMKVAKVSNDANAAAIVAGLLADAHELWPNATGNQLTASLLATSTNGGARSMETGWGAVQPGRFLSNDPTQYPDINPLLNKVTDIPDDQQLLTPKMYDDYVNGLADPTEWIFPYGNQTYRYAGTDENILQALDPAQIKSPMTGKIYTVSGVSLWITVAIPIAALVLLVIVGLVVIRHRSHRRHPQS